MSVKSRTFSTLAIVRAEKVRDSSVVTTARVALILIIIRVHVGTNWYPRWVEVNNTNERNDYTKPQYHLKTFHNISTYISKPVRYFTNCCKRTSTLKIAKIIEQKWKIPGLEELYLMALHFWKQKFKTKI